MINQKINYPNYLRSLLFELQCENDERTIKVIINYFISIHKEFNKGGFQNSLSETTLGNRPTNNCQFQHHSNS